ncbi:hypothetical protein KFL_010450025 [Klebsormidium nitens]|uniref:Uncharacterized protein n=1 Tax=Klebsormidium nitens TaxID=105231 RepID=A0A1Y1INR7_KLENI|nr:hypothetical protein KFL_010450025 [Klebsormidium nitens]|eukprot:GAQ92545.1 hypothetical protein KFL_010450025 [Klebsormidium nitens]
MERQPAQDDLPALRSFALCPAGTSLQSAAVLMRQWQLVLGEGKEGRGCLQEASGPGRISGNGGSSNPVATPVRGAEGSRNWGRVTSHRDHLVPQILTFQGQKAFGVSRGRGIPSVRQGRQPAIGHISCGFDAPRTDEAEGKHRKEVEEEDYAAVLLKMGAVEDPLKWHFGTPKL